MHRRAFLATSSAAVVGLAAGCLTDEHIEEYDGQQVTYLDPEDVYEIWEEGEALFVDTRSVSEYSQQHIEGAVVSPAPDGLEEDDPVADWPQEDPIIVYCPCPYDLSVQRGATLLNNGYEDVKGLDDGFQAWLNEGWPTDQGEPEELDLTHEIEGETDEAYASEPVIVTEGASGRETRTYVNEDGSYGLSLHFSGISESTPLTIEAPDYTVEGTVAELTETTVTAQLA